MKELEEFLQKELNFLAQKKDDWGNLTIEDDSRERTLLEVQDVVKKLPIHNVSNCGGGIPYDSLSDSFKKSIDSIEENLNK